MDIRKWFILAGVIDFAFVFVMFFIVLKVINKYDPFLKRDKKKKPKKMKKKKNKLDKRTKDTSMDYTNYFNGSDDDDDASRLNSSSYDNYGTVSCDSRTETTKILTESTETRLIQPSTRSTNQLSLKDLNSLGMDDPEEIENTSGRYYSTRIAPVSIMFTEKKWLEYINEHRKELDGGIITFTSLEIIQSSLMKNGEGAEEEDEEMIKVNSSSVGDHIQFYIDVISKGTDFLQSQSQNSNGMFQIFTRKKADGIFNPDEIQKQENSLVVSTGLIPTLLKDKRGSISFDKIRETLKACSIPEDESHKIIVVQNVKTMFSGYDEKEKCLKGTRNQQNVSVVLCNVGIKEDEVAIEDAYKGAYLAAVEKGVSSLFLSMVDDEGFTPKLMYNAIWRGFKDVALNRVNEKLTEVHLVVHEVSNELATFYNFLSYNEVDVKINKK